MLNSLTQYIPLQSGQSAFLKTQNLINNLSGQVGYEISGDGYIVFTEDIVAAGVTSIDMQLVVMDFDHYNDYDILPLQADMAGDVVREVLALLMPAPPQDGRVDSLTEEVPQRRAIE